MSILRLTYDVNQTYFAPMAQQATDFSKVEYKLKKMFRIVIKLLVGNSGAKVLLFTSKVVIIDKKNHII